MLLLFNRLSPLPSPSKKLVLLLHRRREGEDSECDFFGVACHELLADPHLDCIVFCVCGRSVGWVRICIYARMKQSKARHARRHGRVDMCVRTYTDTYEAKRNTKRTASERSVSWVEAPWLMGACLRPSSSYRHPSRTMKQMKCVFWGIHYIVGGGGTKKISQGQQHRVCACTYPSHPQSPNPKPPQPTY